MPQTIQADKRLVSLDFMRGFIMILLALESAGLYENLDKAIDAPVLNGIITQFFHHPWHGLRFWDLIQPAFMFMAGTAMAFSQEKQQRKGLKWSESFTKTLKRCGWLFFFGVLDYAVGKDGSLSFKLWDVLTQLSFTTLVAFLIFRWGYAAQAAVCIGLLLVTELLYRYTNIPGFDQPFVDQHNFGNFMDLVLMNKINSDGWVAINCIPTAVHTIAGAMAGKYIINSGKTVKPFLIAGAIVLAAGFALDIAGITPIIKRIATSSFTLASLGYCLFALAFVYWWIDLKDHRRYLSFFLVAGMNSLFLYLFFEIVGHRWFTEYIYAITNGLMEIVAVPKDIMLIISALIVFMLEWYQCYFLYKKKIFFRL